MINQLPMDMLKIRKQTITICLVQDFEAYFPYSSAFWGWLFMEKLQDPELRNNPENFQAGMDVPTWTYFS